MIVDKEVMIGAWPTAIGSVWIGFLPTVNLTNCAAIHSCMRLIYLFGRTNYREQQVT